MLGFFVPFTYIGYYKVAFSLIFGIISFSSFLSSLLLPIFTVLETKRLERGLVNDLSEEIRLLAALSNAFGPPGNEEEVREVLRKELEEYADEVRVDKLGNILFYHHGMTISFD